MFRRFGRGRLTNKVEFLEPYIIKSKVDSLLQKSYEQEIYDFNSATPLDQITEIVCDLSMVYEDLEKDYGQGTLGLINFEEKTIKLDLCLDNANTKQFCDEGRCNFTIGHELGHYYLHFNLFKQDNSLKLFHNNECWQSKWIETQADMFSAMLNMPSELMIKKWNKDFSCIKNLNTKIFNMTSFFRVSREAMQNRLYNLGLLKGL